MIASIVEHADSHGGGGQITNGDTQLSTLSVFSSHARILVEAHERGPWRR